MSRISLLLTNILQAHGVRTAIVSPGARSSAIVERLVASEIEVNCVIDERSAAFIALGIAEVTQMPVALVCTSGSAVLNYAPAISEAYY
ncbi:MAG: 2-succinyl-5-enolpyruvyl-6-hydroxy-3-cyclohexene-1-carboxylic-acid synthase, partial [Paramuribaculum sp.]|nr:2-succinyl-5-enolpyruvyl-6-hydroxy-3-cyclohexene-1-carboxylic-acid synthase [Paramuribaculum sp.]